MVLAALDATLLAGAITIATLANAEAQTRGLHGFTYAGVSLVLGVAWCTSLALTRSYEARFLTEGPEEFKRTVQASARVALVVGVMCFTLKLPVSRPYVSQALLLGTLVLLSGRFLARELVRWQWRRGNWRHRAVVVGAADEVAQLREVMRTSSSSGFEVVAAVTVDGSPVADVDVVPTLEELPLALQTYGADTVAVLPWSGMDGDRLAEIAQDLEGTSASLLVAPSLLNIAGSRVDIHPAAGLPLLRLAEVELSGPGRAIKEVLDRSLALLFMLISLPLVVPVALLLRVTGPVLHPERRVGRDGEEFLQLRFRTHRTSAGSMRRAEDAPLSVFGRFLHWTRLDDLPMVINVLRGDMSLVGPRAILPGRRAGDDVRQMRRLLVKPGVTGLAQVSGRDGLLAEEALRLDQQYVDNWSLGLDLIILGRTLVRLMRGGRLS